MTTKTWTLVISLLGIGAASIVKAVAGADFIGVPVILTVTLAASAAVIWTRKPTIGLIVAAWLSLAWVFMPSTTIDHLRDPAGVGIFVGALAQLLANAAALVSGALAEREYRRRLHSDRRQQTERGVA
jgi:hypothetical protein